jgi:hypothetical protein
MTTKRIAASQANGRRSQGPATPEGRERIRAANIRHGFYSQAEEVALACLGEDPAELARLRQNLHDDLQPRSPLQAEMGEHLAQVLWRWKRAGRMQEGYALRLARNANLTREDRLHGQMMRLKITSETLLLLSQSVAREDYFTTPQTASGALRDAAPGHPKGVHGGSVALRTRRGNCPRPPRRGADAEDGRVQLSANLADYHPAPEDQKRSPQGGIQGKALANPLSL